MNLASKTAPVEAFGHEPELDDEVAGEVLRLEIAPLFLPEAKEGGLICAHDDAGVRAADKGAPVFIGSCPHVRFHPFLCGRK
jgi:hypothetical protein